MSQSEIIIYGAEWCWDCKRARKFLADNAIPFEWVDIDHNSEAEEFVLRVNRGYRSVPTLVFPDGTILTEPSNSRLSQKLGLSQGIPSK